MRQKIITMLSMQDAMNEKVHSNWIQQNFEWYRAIWIEAAELLDHYGWKWWKKQEPDREQVVLELIDIWHFGLSILLSKESNYELIVDKITQQLTSTENTEDFRLSLEAFTLETLKSRDFDVPGFARLMAGMQLGFDELYRTYVGKNVLNFFRQDHGYKDGTYLKVWRNKEDNEHLAEVVAGLDDERSDFREAVYNELSERYRALAS